jgi:hypothetical protein
VRVNILSVSISIFFHISQVACVSMLAKKKRVQRCLSFLFHFFLFFFFLAEEVFHIQKQLHSCTRISCFDSGADTEIL